MAGCGFSEWRVWLDTVFVDSLGGLEFSHT